MNMILILLVILPFLAFCTTLLFKNTQEKWIALIASSVSLTLLMLNVYMLFAYVSNGSQPISQSLITLYKTKEYIFSLELFYDWLGGSFAIIGNMLFWVVSRFSKTYMHREYGYKRFYNHFLLFFSGINVLLMSGNFETLFLGWELVGISSFLLISFYRERYLPIKNGLKVISFYRIGDVALITAIWLFHHVNPHHLAFDQLQNNLLTADIFQHHGMVVFLGSLLFVIAAGVKSAQFPFFTWLPRAMEGPTVSSAIFYGSMSIHLGVFLLLRTFPLWQYSHEARIIMGIMGGLTAIMASMITMVQSTGKSQIAYASCAQLGLMFVEISLGFHELAIVHFACNALFRTYQLLSSPSMMSYWVKKQFYEYIPNTSRAYGFLSVKWRNTLFTLAVSEFFMDRLWYVYQWKFFKRIGKSLHFMRNGIAETIIVIGLIIAIAIYVLNPIELIRSLGAISWIYGVVALMLILIAWTERISVLRAWIYVMCAQVFFMLSISQEHAFNGDQIALYLSGTITSFCLGYWSLYKVKSQENSISLHEFHGHIYEHPRYALTFLISSLMMIGFPISPTFIGLDLLFSDIEFTHTFLLFISALTFLLVELTVLRIYARIFLGRHVKTYHEVAFRST